MKIINESSFTTEFGTSYGIGIETGGKQVLDFPIPDPDISADTIIDSTVEASHIETINDVAYFIKIHSSLGSVKVYVLGDENASKDISVVLLSDYECPVPEEPTPSSRIKTYVPMIKYTRTAKNVYDFAHHGANKRIVPLIDIRKEEQITEYTKDNFDVLHFLDLCALQKNTTIEEHSRIKEERKRQKMLGIHKDSRTPFPADEYIDLELHEKFGHYIELSSTKTIIPVWRISMEKKPSHTKEYAEQVRALFEMYDACLAWRVMDTKNFIVHIEDYLEPLKGHLDKCYIIIEFVGDDRKYEWECIQKIENLRCGIQVVFTKQTLDYEQAVIKMNHVNLIPNTSLGSFYEHAFKSENELWYSDYCGYDRDTATTYIIGMNPSSSLYLLNHHDGIEMMLLKIKHPDEKGTRARTKSPILLAEYVKTHPNVKSFIDCKHCEACEFVCDANTFTLENAKVACMKHNVRVISTL